MLKHRRNFAAVFGVAIGFTLTILSFFALTIISVCKGPTLRRQSGNISAERKLPLASSGDEWCIDPDAAVRVAAIVAAAIVTAAVSTAAGRVLSGEQR